MFCVGIKAEARSFSDAGPSLRLLEAEARCTTVFYAFNIITTLTIRLPDTLKGDLDKLSRRENKTVGDMVRESLRRYVAVEKFRSVRKKIMPFAEAQP